ncbi:MAG: signal recognition particle-docking protein FtsY [Flavobacteriales bacterium]|tara:strand:+ start:55 stop:1044 length:990 start_codon:yes stop_codon:yes gene_type:complete
MGFFNKIKSFLTSNEEENTSDKIEKQKKLNDGLEKTKSSLFEKISKKVVGKSKIDDEDLDDIEEILITSDIGVDTSLKIIESLEKRVQKEKYISSDELTKILKEEIELLLVNSTDIDSDVKFESDIPYVIMVVGVNGVGKTTTIGKLAYKFKKSGFKVVLGAADTFRAAAIDQLTIWADRVGVEIVKQNMGSDPASVAYDTLQSAISKNADVVIIDTAGRLHNKVNLMNELSKVKSVMSKLIPNAPHDVLLVLDASTGQNAIEQAKQFSSVTQVNSLALTKLDGTAKGGVVIGISDQLKIPVRFIGVGEAMEDLQIFNKETFVDTLFNN